MEQQRRAMKVLSPVTTRSGRTMWLRLGRAYENRDGSTNVYLEAYPANGRLQIRELDERDLQKLESSDRTNASPTTEPHTDLPF